MTGEEKPVMAIVAKAKTEIKARVGVRKAELARWLGGYSPADQIEVRIAMLETVLDELIATHGEFDTAELVTVAMERAVAKARGPLQ